MYRYTSTALRSSQKISQYYSTSSPFNHEYPRMFATTFKTIPKSVSSIPMTMKSPLTVTLVRKTHHSNIYRTYYRTFFSRKSSKDATKNAALAAATKKTPLFRKIRERLIRAVRLLAYLRIPFLVVMVHQIGYQQGMVDYAHNPSAQDKALLKQMLSSFDADSESDVMVVEDGHWSSYHGDERLERVAAVGHAILKVARKCVEVSLNAAMDECLESVRREVEENPENVDAKELSKERLEEDYDVELWAKAKTRLDGDWKYVLIKSDIPNAFVSELLPKRIFITTGMFDNYITNDDELALVLGHELSHVILGHGSEKARFRTWIRTLEIFLLTIDPTDGLVSLAIMSSLAFSSNAMRESYSRFHEREADELGIKFAAMACFNTKKASEVFHKMHLHKVELGLEKEGSKSASILDSHPADEERFLNLLEASEHENKTKYEHSCASVKRSLLEMLHWRKQSKESDIEVIAVKRK